jgi:hypothetical protein
MLHVALQHLVAPLHLEENTGEKSFKKKKKKEGRARLTPALTSRAVASFPDAFGWNFFACTIGLDVCHVSDPVRLMHVMNGILQPSTVHMWVHACRSVSGKSSSV